jgi:hypothetical protein
MHRSLLIAALLAIGVVSGMPLLAVHAQTTSQLTVNSQDTGGNTLTGYYVALYSGGTLQNTGYTPAIFNLVDGQTYVVEVGNYGSCNFNNWSDTGSTNPSRSITISANTQITAVYNCGTPVGSSVTVKSVDQNGAAITGYYTVLFTSSGSVQSTGYTPTTFATASGQTYSVQVDSYGNCIFDQWSDGVTSNPRPFSATSSAQSFTAVLGCGSAGTSQLTIATQDLNSTSLAGFYTSLTQSGTLVASGFTTHTFTLNNEQTYTVSVDGYGSCVFNHWADTGSNSPSRNVLISSNTKYTAVMACAGDVGGPGTITVSAHRIPASYWAPCFATTCTNSLAACDTSCTGPGAQMYFVLYNSAGSVVATAFADENGYVFTGLTPGATYSIYASNCDMCHGSTHSVVFNNWNNVASDTSDPLTVMANGTSVAAWYTCTNSCSGGP